MKGSRLRAVLPLTALLIAVASARPAFAQTDAVVPVPADRPEELERASSALYSRKIVTMSFTDHDGLILSKSVEVKVAP